MAHVLKLESICLMVVHDLLVHCTMLGHIIIYLYVNIYISLLNGEQNVYSHTARDSNTLAVAGRDYPCVVLLLYISKIVVGVPSDLECGIQVDVYGITIC